MAANPLAGEAELVVAGVKHLVKVNMRSVPFMCRAIGVDSWPALNEAAQKADNMVPITRALLEANNVTATDDEVADMDAAQWINQVIPALFRYAPKKDDEETNPRKGQRK